jgi:hypothetical protein
MATIIKIGDHIIHMSGHQLFTFLLIILACLILIIKYLKSLISAKFIFPFAQSISQSLDLHLMRSMLEMVFIIEISLIFK